MNHEMPFESSSTTIMELPIEILQIVFKLLSFSDISNLECSCTWMRSAISGFFAAKGSYERCWQEYFEAAKRVRETPHCDSSHRGLIALLKKCYPTQMTRIDAWRLDLTLIWASLKKSWDFVVFRLLVQANLISEDADWSYIANVILTDRKIAELDVFLENVPMRFLKRYNLFKIVSACNCGDGYSSAVKMLLEDADCNPAADQNFAICDAAARGHAEVVKLLLADPRVNPAHQRNKALCNAAENGRIEILRLLMEDARVQKAGKKGCDAVLLAAWVGCIEAVKLLLAKNRFDPEFAIQNASKCGHYEIVELLMRDPRVNSRDRSEAIAYAAERGYTGIVEMLMKDPRVDHSKSDNNAVRRAAGNRHTKVVQMLLKDPRVDPSVRCSEALRSAALNGYLDIAELLLSDPRVDPAEHESEAIHWAASSGHTEMVELLLKDSRVNPATENNRAIIWAAERGHAKVIELLLMDPRVNPADANNEAIRRAAAWGHAGAVQLLLGDPRVDPSAKGDEPIKLAVEGGHAEVVKVLLSDSRINPSSHGNDLIRHAALLGRVEIVELLLGDPRAIFDDQLVQELIDRFDVTWNTTFMQISNLLRGARDRSQQ